MEVWYKYSRSKFYNMFYKNYADFLQSLISGKVVDSNLVTKLTGLIALLNKVEEILIRGVAQITARHITMNVPNKIALMSQAKRRLFKSWSLLFKVYALTGSQYSEYIHICGDQLVKTTNFSNLKGGLMDVFKSRTVKRMRFNDWKVKLAESVGNINNLNVVPTSTVRPTAGSPKTGKERAILAIELFKHGIFYMFPYLPLVKNMKSTLRKLNDDDVEWFSAKKNSTVWKTGIASQFSTLKSIAKSQNWDFMIFNDKIEYGSPHKITKSITCLYVIISKILDIRNKKLKNFLFENDFELKNNVEEMFFDPSDEFEEKDKQLAMRGKILESTRLRFEDLKSKFYLPKPESLPKKYKLGILNGKFAVILLSKMPDFEDYTPSKYLPISAKALFAYAQFITRKISGKSLGISIFDPPPTSWTFAYLNQICETHALQITNVNISNYARTIEKIEKLTKIMSFNTLVDNLNEYGVVETKNLRLQNVRETRNNSERYLILLDYLNKV